MLPCPDSFLRAYFSGDRRGVATEEAVSFLPCPCPHFQGLVSSYEAHPTCCPQSRQLVEQVQSRETEAKEIKRNSSESHSCLLADSFSTELFKALPRASSEGGSGGGGPERTGLI